MSRTEGWAFLRNVSEAAVFTNVRGELSANNPTLLSARNIRYKISSDVDVASARSLTLFGPFSKRSAIPRRVTALMEDDAIYPVANCIAKSTGFGPFDDVGIVNTPF
jgi:hypothetical protein